MVLNKNNNSKSNTSHEKKEPARAPYNFISFPNEVVVRYENEEDVPKFDEFREDLNTGYIDFEFKNETDLFVGGQKDEDNNIEFFKNTNGDICIPGSSMRGVIRKNCEVLSFSYPEFIENRTYLYRHFAGRKGKLKNEYKKIINVKRGQNDISDIVKVGYIYRQGNDYKVIPVQEINGKCFRLVNERRLRKDFNIPEREIKYMYTKMLLNFESKKRKSKEAVDRMNENEKRYYDKEMKNELSNYLNRCKNNFYEPYKINVTFDIDYENDEIKDIKIQKSQKKYEREGVLFNSNRLIPKLNHYLIYDIDNDKEEYIINDDVILDYKKDIDMFKSQRNGKGQKTEKDYYDLPKEEGKEHKKIFFYKLEDNTVKYLGKTPYLRVSYKNSQKSLLKTIKPSSGLDYIQAMFGYTSEDKNAHNIKSRVSFMDVVCESPCIDTKEYNLILSSPKPTSQQLYLKQYSHDSSKLNTYNQEKAELRGYKFYWNKDIDKKDSNTTKTTITTTLKNTLKINNKFKSRVYFENLTKDELGLLLLGIKFNEECKESIGMGKPYGYGRIDIRNINLYLEDIDSKFINFNNNYKEVEDKEKYKKEFRAYMNKKINKDYINEISIQEYVKLKTNKKINNSISYMNLVEHSELGKLPNVLEVK